MKAPFLYGGLHKGFAVHVEKINRARGGVYFFQPGVAMWSKLG
jgi:hypothetical protein